MNKERDLKFIKDFSKITIKGVCDELNANRSNVLNGNASPEAIAAVKNKIVEKIEALEK